MRYELINNALTVTAESVLDGKALEQLYRLINNLTFDEIVEGKAERIVKAIQAGNLVHVDQASEKRPWFAVATRLGSEYLKPYRDLLERLTGYAGALPELVCGYPHGGLRHTHIVAQCTADDNGLAITGFIRAEDWNGGSALNNALTNFRDYVAEDFGFRHHETEYVRKGGTMVRNPEYTKWHKAQPGLGNTIFWAQLFQWWRDTQASDAQRALLDRADALLDRADALKASSRLDPDYALRFGGDEQARLVGASCLYTGYDPVEHTPWADFRLLGKGD